MPAARTWNGDLVVYAHGYVAPTEPLRIPEDHLNLDGTYLPELVTNLGFAFATTSYSINGLAVRQGTADLADVVDLFAEQKGTPDKVYLVGPSEGGINTALSIERYPDVFDGGVAACGPVGSFRRQINNWGDFRVVFDYFFPGLIPGSPVDVPPEVMEDWEDVYVPRIAQAIVADPAAAEQLLRVTGAPIDRKDPASVLTTIIGLLYYNVFATNDGIEKLGGQPFDNTRRIYHGSDNDWRLNRQVQRFVADPAALEEIAAHYETSGLLTRPLVTLHTSKDPIIRYWHEPLYAFKIRRQGTAHQHVNIPVLRYGHCNFNRVEVLASFALLVFMVERQPLTGVEEVLLQPDDQEQFRQLLDRYQVEAAPLKPW
jgi:pimeloyl-ACP methyl ester carboxylesterase